MFGRVIIALVIVIGLASSAMAERRVALVLAVEDYRNLRDLANPVNDARAMEELLESLGFEVWLESDRNLSRSLRALEDFRQDAAGADVALFFYAGHGVAIEGVNYLLPTDAEITSSARLAETSLPLSAVQAVLDEVAPVSIVLLDACRDDPFGGIGGSGDGRGAVALDEDPADRPPPVPGLGRIGRADGVLFAFAAAPGETASDGDGRNSPFTSALLRHFATGGVELKSALTLVQQDVYDRSRGRQLPYIESGLPELVFIAEAGELPERDQLLMAMAGLTETLRHEVESVAEANNMPLAPLYAALISGDLARENVEERRRKLEEAARSYAAFQSELVKYASDDPRVAQLRAEAEEALSLGAFEAARARLTEAAAIDSTARLAIRDNYLTRTLSEASTHVLNANAARTDLRYDLAIGDLTRAVELYAEIESDLPDRETRLAYVMALAGLGELHLIAGNSFGALGAHMTRAEFLERQARAEPFDLGWTRELIWALNNAGTVLQQLGYLREAEEAFMNAFTFSQRQSDQNPDDRDLMRDRAVMQNKLGEVRYAQNDHAGALAAYAEALAIAEALLETDPTRIVYLQDVSYTQERIGDVHAAMGDYAAARAAFDISLRIAQSLWNEFPNDPSMRRDMSVGLERLADMTAAEGDLDTALAIYLESLNIREELVARDPSHMLLRRDLAVTYERIGDIHYGRGDAGSAVMSHVQAMTIREELVALDAANTEWARDLSVSHERLGDLYLAEGEHGGALASYQRARDLRLAIVALDPTNLPRQRDLGVTYEKLALFHAALDDMDRALAAYLETLELRRRLVDADPWVVLYQRDLGIVLVNLAEMLRFEDSAQAGEMAAEAIAINEALVARHPDDTLYLRDLTVSQNIWASILMDQGDGGLAAVVARDSLEVTARLLELRPGDRQFTIDRLVAANRLGDAELLLGAPDRALPIFRIMAEAGYAVSSADPYDVEAASLYATALERMAEALRDMGEHRAARVELESAVAIRRWIAGQDPASLFRQRELVVTLHNYGATFLETGEYREGAAIEEEALAIQRWIVGQSPGDTLALLGLVVALDRAALYYTDAAAYVTEALEIMEWLDAEGRLNDPVYYGWLEDFRIRAGR
ncbi:caspase family protein [Pseudogemmobacter sonorensis]|uniref:caspase family protein n=1 Tax=Pseudogemmobacter sonorensis TaxID=2989681 RepID=UPI0036C16B0E